MNRKNLLKYLFEFTAVLLGILTAFSLERWNEDREKIQLIEEVMEDVVMDLENNLDDLKGDKDFHQAAIISNARLIHTIDNEIPYEPEMCFDFYLVQAEEYSYPLMTGYKRLLNINVNSSIPDTIVNELTDIYEVLFPRIQKGSSLMPDIKEFFRDYYLNHFTLNMDSTLTYQMDLNGREIVIPNKQNIEGYRVNLREGFHPLDFDQLKNDPKFRIMLNESAEFRIYKYSRYRSLIKVIEKVIDDIRVVYDIPKN